MNEQLAGRVIVITGASSGIGRAVAVRCARMQANLVLVAREPQALEETLVQVRAEGGTAMAMPGDVSDWAFISQVADRTAAAWGKIDVWINAAAAALYGALDEVTVEEFRRVIDVNLLGTVYGVKAALPYMQRAQAGTIINVGSVLSQRAVPLQSSYVASKHAIRGFTDALRMELMDAHPGIHVTLVMPSSINTPFFTHARSHMGVRPQPIPPVYDAETAADVIVNAIFTHPRDAYVGGSAIGFVLLQKISPGLLDRLMTFRRLGFRLQQTDRPEDSTQSDALFSPTQGTHRVDGEFSHLTKPSMYSTAAAAKADSRLIAGVLMLVGLAIGSQILRRRSS
jgi:short-subunit dehydrogenase